MRASPTAKIRSVKLDENGAARTHLKEAVTATRAGVRDLGSAAKEVASAEVSRLGDRVSAIRDDTRAQVTKNPIASLLIAAGVGLVVGFLLRRR